jgi:hypothetical protein
MTRQLLLEALNKWLFLDLILLMLVYGISWIIILELGFSLLKVKIKIKNIIIGALLGAFVSLFIKPLIPGIANFFVTLIPLLFFLKFYGKTKWVIACWVTFILLLSTSLGPLLIITPLISSDHTLVSFFHGNRYGIILGTLVETIGITILLLFFKIFNIYLIPNPKRMIFTNFNDIFIFGGLLFLCYYQFMLIWEGVKNTPILFLIKPFVGFMVAAGVFIAFSIKKGYDQKKDQVYQQLKESKVDLQDLVSFSHKLNKTLNPDTDPIFESLPKFTSAPEFTSREKDVIHLIAKGYDNAAISKKLHLSKESVGNLIVPIRAKINEQIVDGIPISDRMLVVYAIYWSRMNK